MVSASFFLSENNKTDLGIKIRCSLNVKTTSFFHTAYEVIFSFREVLLKRYAFQFYYIRILNCRQAIKLGIAE